LELDAVNDNHCFCCGKDNDLGLKLEFSYPEPGTAETRCTIPGHFSGWKSTTHGGFLAMLMDEIMAHACISAGELAITAQMTVRYRNPIPTGEEILVAGRVKAQRSRIIETTAVITQKEGLVVAEAEGRFLKAQPGKKLVEGEISS
jgi:acyl-coenzyme A thioesterase PaaI-like protein